MIPISLTIQGLFSYQNRQTIDFTKLTEANIFGIFGSVGSGKSSILDAISFALYGETERMNARDNRNYNMMNLKSDELFIEFHFIAENKNRYQVTVKGKRNSKNFEDVKKLDRAAYVSNNNSWTPIELSQIPEIIGLSYENFKRTIIIPQGKFQEFLQLGAKDRTQMMKELFNLGKFELYYKVASLEGKNNKKKIKLEGQIQQLGEVKTEQVDEAKQKLVALTNEVKELSNDLLTKQKEEAEVKQLKDLSLKLKETERNLSELNRNKKNIKSREKSLIEYEKCIVTFKSLIVSFDDISKRIEELSKELTIDNATLEKYKSELKALEEKFKEAEKSFKNRDNLKQKSEELEKIADIFNLEKENIVSKQNLEKGTSLFSEKEKDIENIKSKKSELEKEIKALKDKLPDVEELSKAKDWHTNNNLLAETKKSLEKDKEDIFKNNNSINNELALIGKQAICLDTTPKKLTEHLNANIGVHKLRISEIEKELQHFAIQQKLKEFATSLEDGSPCPLCGSESHPNILNSEDVSLSVFNANKTKFKEEEKISFIEKLKEKINPLSSKLELNNENILKTDKQINEIIKKIDNHKNLFKWEKYKDIAVVESSFNNLKTLTQAIKEKEGLFNNTDKNIEKETSTLEKFKLRIDELKTIVTINSSKISTLSTQVKNLNIEDFKSNTPEELIKQSQESLNLYNKIEQDYNKLLNDINEINKKKDALSGKISANTNSLNNDKKAKSDIEKDINTQLTNFGYSSLESVREIVAKNINIEQERKEIEDFNKNINTLNKQLEELSSQINGKTYEEEKYKELIEVITRVNNTIEIKNQEIGKTNEEIKKLIANIEQQKEFRKQLDKLELRAENIKTLKNLFKGSGFVNYVSSVHLQNLCNAANERFYKLTRQKLSLEITDDNNFQVRDFMNGGKVRSVKTLSGGQTFQASLSLALALSDSIQKFTSSSQNFFFLDEGFGSLDKEALDVVFDTLKSLRKENRIVGVISHVEDMQQEVTTYLNIINNDETGSLIEESWMS